jgi:hypothetical protein
MFQSENPVGGWSSAQDRVEDILVGELKGGACDRPEELTGIARLAGGDVCLALIHQPKHLLALLAPQEDQRRANVGPPPNRTDSRELAPLLEEPLVGRTKRRHVPATRLFDQLGEGPGDDDVGIDQDRDLGRVSEGGDGLQQVRRRVAGRRDQGGVRRQQLALARSEPAVEHVGGLSVAEQAQRVEQPHRAQEVA